MAAITANADADHVAQIVNHLAGAIENATAKETRIAAKNPKIGAVNHVTDANAAIKNSEDDKRLMFCVPFKFVKCTFACTENEYWKTIKCPTLYNEP